MQQVCMENAYVHSLKWLFLWKNGPIFPWGRGYTSRACQGEHGSMHFILSRAREVGCPAKTTLTDTAKTYRKTLAHKWTSLKIRGAFLYYD